MLRPRRLSRCGAIGGVAAAAIPTLLRALRRGEGDLPAGAAFALGCMGALAIEKAAPALRRALRHDDPAVVKEAADALRALGFGDAVPANASGEAGIRRHAEAYRLDPRFRSA